MVRGVDRVAVEIVAVAAVADPECTQFERAAAGRPFFFEASAAGTSFDLIRSMTEPLALGPPRDRRSRKRLMTRKNVFFTCVAIAVVLTGAMIYADVRSGEVDRNRLQSGRLAETVPVAPAAIQPVEAEEGSGSATVDPLSVEAHRRSEVLGVSQYGEETVQVDDYVIDEIDRKPVVEQPLARENRDGRTDSRFVIRGDAGGVDLSVRPQ